MIKFTGAPYSLYSELNISEYSTHSEIKSAYLALAKQFHPDKNGGDDTHFKEIQHAYEILSKSEHKRLYDEYSQNEINKIAEKEIIRQNKEKRSAIYRVKNPRNIARNITEWIQQNLNAKFKDIWSKNIDDSLSKEISQATTDLVKKFSSTPFDEIHQNLVKAERLSKFGKINPKSIQEILNQLTISIPGTDTSFWESKLNEILLTSTKDSPKKTKTKDIVQQEPTNKKQQELESIYQHILEFWRHRYEEILLQWMISEIESAKQKIYSKYQKLLNNLRQIKRTLGNFPDLGWGLELGHLTQQDLQEVLKWGKFFQDNPQIQELCETLGHLNQEASRQEKEKILLTYRYEQTKIDCNSKEEITGITFGKNIEDALPQELALLSNLETAILFDLKFIESRLMCFEKQGYISEQKEEIKEEERDVEKKDKKGPIIVCVDTSGSMAGTPECIAKAITLCMASIAYKQNRDCYLINFSTTIETFDFKPPKGIKDLIVFLKSSFHGGTDVMPALDEGLKMMQEGSYKKADLLVISDFIFPMDDAQTLNKVKKQRQNDNYFYALSIMESNDYGFNYYKKQNQKIFDEAWVYSPSNGNIRQLYSSISKIGTENS